MLEIGRTTEASLADDGIASCFALPNRMFFRRFFPSARMIALMETAGARVLKPQLQAGQLSVGVTVNIKHLAATPNHTSVSAQAPFLDMESKLYKFKIEAFDPGSKIGEGEHTRAIISTERLMKGAKASLQSTEAKLR